MDNSTVFTKTAKGITQVNQRSASLSKDLMKVLKAIDGKSNFGQIVEKLEMDKPGLEKAVNALIKDGFARIFETRKEDAFGEDDFDFTAPGKISAPPQRVVAAAALDITELARQQERQDAERKAREDAQNAARNKAKLQAEARATAEAEARSKAEAEKRALEEAVRAKVAAERAKADLEVKLREEEARRKRVEELKSKIEAEQKAQAEEEARKLALLRARAEAEANARAKAELEARVREEEQRKRDLEAQAAREAAERKAREEAEVARVAELRVKAEREAQALAEARAKAEAEAQALAQARAEADAAAKRSAQDAVASEKELKERLKEEIEARIRSEMEALLRDEMEEKTRAELQAQIMAEARLAAKAELEERLREEREALQKAELEARKQAEQAARERADEEAKLRAEAEARAVAERAARERAEEEAAQLRLMEARAREEIAAAAREKAEAATAAARERDEAEKRLQAERRAREEAERRAKLEAEAAERQKAEVATAAAREREEAQKRLEAARQARIEAEARAMVEAEERERKEKELAAKIEAERRGREEAEKRAHAEAQARASVEVTTREKVKAEIEGDMTRRAELEGKAQARAYMEAKEKAERDEEERQRAEQEKKAREIADILRTKVGGEEKGEARVVARGPRGKSYWVKLAAVGVVLLLAVGVGLLHVIPLRGFGDKLEKGIAGWMHEERVSISNVKFTLFPTPHLKVEGLAAGKLLDVKASHGRAYVDLTSLLFGDRPSISRLELENVSIVGDGPRRILSWGVLEGKTNAAHIEAIHLRSVKLDTKPEFKPFDANLSFAKDGSLRQARLSGEGKWNVTVQPKEEQFEFTLNASGWELPMGVPVPISGLVAKGVISAAGLEMQDIDADVADGKVGGTLQASWKDGVRVVSDLTFTRVAVEPFLRPFTTAISVTGKVDGKFTIALASADLASLTARPQMQGSFRIAEGWFSNTDLVAAMQSPEAGGRGVTKFTELGGEIAVADGRISYKSLNLQGGVLRASGAVDVAASGAVSGRLAVEIRSNVAQDRATFGVSGTVARPVLRRGG